MLIPLVYNCSMSVARKHHYIPQSYLAAFTDNGKKDGKFYVYDVEGRRFFVTSPGNVAAERDFNRVDIEGHPPDAMEKELAQFEKEAICAFRAVNETREYPSAINLNLILNMACLLFTKNPRNRRMMENFEKQTIRIIVDRIASDKRLFESTTRSARKKGILRKGLNVSFENYQQFVRKGNYRAVIPRENHIVTESFLFNSLFPLFGKRVWSLLVIWSAPH